MPRNIKNVTEYVLNHLKMRVSEHPELLLRQSVATIDYNVEKLRYYVHNQSVYLYITTDNMNDYYARQFEIKMILEPHRYAFSTLQTAVTILVDGLVEVDYGILIDVLNDWGITDGGDVEFWVDYWRQNPLKEPYDWQIIGTKKFSIETSSSKDVFSMPLALLDYAFQYIEKLEKIDEEGL